MKLLHLGAYSMGAYDIVRLMALALQEVCDGAVVVDLNLYPRRRGLVPGDRARWCEPADGGVNWLRRDRLEELIALHAPQAIVCNAGGLSPTPEHHQDLARRGIRRVGIALSDPDVFPIHGARFARHFDLFYTNARASLAEYARIGVAARLLPFAAHPGYHRPLAGVGKRFDVVVVGGGRPDRLGLVRALRRSGHRVGLFGRGWNWWDRVLPTSVHGEAQVRAINSGKLYLSFSRTLAGFTNVKVGLFEAAACRSCILTERFDELGRYFEYGSEVLGHGSIDEAVELASRHARDAAAREAVAERAYRRLLAEHTWQRRWREIVLADLGERCGLR